MNKIGKKEKSLLDSFPKHKDYFLKQMREDSEYAQMWFNAALTEYRETQDVADLVFNLKPMIEANYTICDFAKKIGINRVTLYKIFSSKMVPSIEVLNKIFNGLGYELLLQAKKV